MFSLKNKSAIITGGGSGIGKAIALLFAKQGAAVHVIELTENAGKDGVDEINNLYGNAFLHVCDVSNQQQVLQIFNAIDKIDILVNNAGIAHIGKAHTTSEEDFDRVMKVNVKGVYNCLYATIPIMLKNKAGVILNMASVLASVGVPDRFAYTASKAAIAGITLSVAKDYINDNIRCNSISPARVHTPFVDGYISKNYPGQETEMFQKLSKTQPIGRMANPQEIASLALYLCSDEASFVTGCDYVIDGGFTKLNN